MNENNSNDLQSIITQAIEEMKSEQGSTFDLNKINLAELGRRTGLSRAQLRRLKKNGFRVTPHGLTGRKADTTIITGYSGVVDDLLQKARKPAFSLRFSLYLWSHNHVLIVPHFEVLYKGL